MKLVSTRSRQEKNRGWTAWAGFVRSVGMWTTFSGAMPSSLPVLLDGLHAASLPEVPPPACGVRQGWQVHLRAARLFGSWRGDACRGSVDRTKSLVPWPPLRLPARFCKRDLGEFAGPIDGHEMIELPFRRLLPVSEQYPGVTGSCAMRNASGRECRLQRVEAIV